MQIFTKDKPNFKTETCCNDMNKSVYEIFEHLDDLTEENLINLLKHLPQ